MTHDVDVVVAGGGNAGLCAAVSAASAGASVLLVEKAAEAERGGNSRFAALYRFPYAGFDDLVGVCPGLADWRGRADIGPYPRQRFHADLLRSSGEGTDEDLMTAVSSDARAAVGWLYDLGARWEVSAEGAVVVDGRYSWQDGYVLRPAGGVRGVLEVLTAALRKAGGQIRYGTALTGIGRAADGRVTGVSVEQDGRAQEITTGAVVLAAGGFEASGEMRATHLGPRWREVKVRGSRTNTGEALRVALASGAARAGGWNRCHATMVHGSAPAAEMGERAFPHAYPYGLLVNRDGDRFADEAPNSFAFTYAGMGERVLDQPGSVAFQLFDAKTTALRQVALYGPAAYDVPHVAADSLPELAQRAGFADPDRFVATVEEFNAAVDDGTEFDPLRPDGRHTKGLTIDKSNWAERIDRAPFELYPVECGITFTFGGLAITPDAQVRDGAGAPIPGMYACGEMSGIFQRGYPGGSGLTAGAVFGRRAGRAAAAEAGR
ncbi:MAG: FAD-dependent tricarballylate dehydrogenase TcuA [Actinocatenispora sp.]